MINRQEVKQNKKQEPLTDRTDLLTLSNAKKIGLSFDELNQFIYADYIEFCDIYVGEKKETRNATQDDIDKLFA